MFLQQVEVTTKPKIKYEQYPTTSRVAANTLWLAGVENDDIYQKTILDLGCGSGILAIGAAYLGAREVFGIDIDYESLLLAQENCYNFSLQELCEWICIDVKDCTFKSIDTIIMNPPFGMRKESLSRDRTFVEIAIQLAKSIYFITTSNEGTRTFFKKFCTQRSAIIDKIITMDFEIKHQYDFHTKKRHITQVDLYRIIQD